MIWTAAVDPAVLSVTATCSRHAAFDLARQCFAVAIDDAGIEHVAIDCPVRTLRIDVIGGTLLRGPVDLRGHIGITAHTGFQLASLDRLLRLSGGRDPARRTPSPDRRLPRLVEALRVADALSEGASLAGIAAGLAPEGSLPVAWPGDGDHVKSAIRRKVALARRLTALGPAGVLAHRT